MPNLQRVFTDLDDSNLPRPNIADNDRWYMGEDGNVHADLQGIFGETVDENVIARYTDRNTRTRFNYLQAVAGNINGVHALTDNVQIAWIGTTLYLTTDGWENYENIITTSLTINDAKIVSETEIFLIINDSEVSFFKYILTSSWDIEYSSVVRSGERPFKFDLFFNENTQEYVIYVINGSVNNRILRSANSGVSFGSFKAASGNVNLWHLQSIGDKILFFLENGGTFIADKSDTGVGTAADFSIGGTVRGGEALDNLVATVVGDSGFITQTLDGGQNWTTVNSANIPTSTTLRDVSYKNTQELTAIGDSGTVIQSIDGGNDWIQQPIQSGTYNTINFKSDGNFVIASSNGLLLQDGNALLTGGDRSKRFSMFYIKRDENNYSPFIFQKNDIVTMNWQNLEPGGEDGSLIYYGAIFVDNNGVPILRTYDLGSGDEQYQGWAVELEKMTNGNLRANRFVLVKPFTNTEPNEDVLDVDLLFDLDPTNRENTPVNGALSLQITNITDQLSYLTTNEIQPENGDVPFTPLWSTLTSRFDFDVPLIPRQVIFNQDWTPAVWGQGGEDSSPFSDPGGLIDNFSMLSDVEQI